MSDEGKKLYRVTIEKTIYVLADDELDAALSAPMHLRDADFEDDDISMQEITSAEGVPEDALDSLPWGSTDDDMTVRAILAAQEAA